MEVGLGRHRAGYHTRGRPQGGPGRGATPRPCPRCPAPAPCRTCPVSRRWPWACPAAASCWSGSPGPGRLSRPPSPRGCGSPDTDSSQSQNWDETQRWNPCSCCLPWTRPGPGQTLRRVQTSDLETWNKTGDSLGDDTTSPPSLKRIRFRNNLIVFICYLFLYYRRI